MYEEEYISVSKIYIRCILLILHLNVGIGAEVRHATISVTGAGADELIRSKYGHRGRHGDRRIPQLSEIIDGAINQLDDKINSCK